MSISRAEILMGRDKDAPLSERQEQNLSRLLSALNSVRAAYGKPMHVTSGYRPAVVNAAIGGAKKSLHMECLACDFKDSDGKLTEWLNGHQDLLAQLGLWQEHPSATKGWAHLDLGGRAAVPRPGCLSRQFKP